MAKKILIECPICGRINEGSTGFFSKRVLKCQCGNHIHVKDARMITKECPNCGNLIVYDRGKDENPKCPVCHHDLVGKDDMHKFVEVICPECELHIVAKKNDTYIQCPVCNETIDVQKRLEEQKYIEQAQPILLHKEISGDICACKHELENARLGSQIIVDESQTAVFIADGKVVGVFGPGRHTIEADNIYLDKDSFDNDKVTFSSKLYYVSNLINTGVRWGTDSKVRLFDPGSGLHVELGACGTFNYRVIDASKFLFNIIGLGNLTRDDYYFDDINLKIKPNVITAVKANLARVLREQSISSLELDEHITEIAALLKELINNDIAKFGVELTDFIVDRIVTPDDDPNFRKMKEQYAEQYLRVRQEKIDTTVLNAEHDKLMAKATNEIDVELYKARAAAEMERIKAAGSADAYKMQAEAEAHEMNVKGYSYQDETARQVSMSAVENGALQGTAGNGGEGGIGLSELAKDAVKADVVKKVGGSIANNIAGSILNPSQEEPTPAPTLAPTQVIAAPSTWKCPNCGQEGITSKFCPECGTPRPAEEWDCPECGTKGIKSKFCPNCGHKK